MYTREEGHDWTFKLRKDSYGSNQCGRYYALDVQFIDFDGENFGFSTQLLQIHAFGGTEPIHQLSAFPLAYHYEVKKVRKGLIARGKIFEA